MPKRLLICAAGFLAISCTPWHYDTSKDTPPIRVESRPVIYTPDGKGGIKRDRRMERIQAQGQQDNSADGGRQPGW